MKWNTKTLKRIKSDLEASVTERDEAAKSAWNRAVFDESMAASLMALNANIERLIFVLENGIQVASVALEDLPSVFIESEDS